MSIEDGPSVDQNLPPEAMYPVVAVKSGEVQIVPRKVWEKYKPQMNMDIELESFKVPATRVRLSRSKGQPCQGLEDCVKRLQWMQWNHMYHWGLQDIAFNFLVSTDGTVYEGRGWRHTPQRIDSLKDKVEGSYLDIGFIGNYKKVTAPIEMENAALNLIRQFVEEGKVDPNYTLLRFKLPTKMQIHIQEAEKAFKIAEKKAYKASKPLYNKHTKLCYRLKIPYVYCPSPEKMRKLNKVMARAKMEDEYTNNFYHWDKSKDSKKKKQPAPKRKNVTPNKEE